MRLATPALPLIAFVPDRASPDPTLTVYIEGDGLAWLDSDSPSSDPTPVDPLALRLALRHPYGNAAYLARACQYVDAEQVPCPSRLWLNARFSEPAIAAADNAISQLKARFGALRLVLVGYSGGGTVAALVAARRNDVVRLLTVAGNLDPREWVRYHRLTPLDGSLNPRDEADRLAAIPQLHFVGAADRNITPGLVRVFVSRLPRPEIAAMVTVPGFDHRCCWANEWPDLLMRYLPP